MHAFKVVFALWLMAYALCVRFHSSENTTQLTEGAAQLDSKGGFTTVRHILQPTVGNESESQGIENHSGMPKMNGTLENHSVLQAAAQIGNETEIVATPSGLPMALNSSTKMNGALIQLHSSNNTAIVQTRGESSAGALEELSPTYLESCPTTEVASCRAECKLSAHGPSCECSQPYDDTWRVKCVPAKWNDCRPSNFYMSRSAIYCPTFSPWKSLKFLVENVKRTKWCEFLIEKLDEPEEQVHVAADVDGTLAPFSDLEERRRIEWIQHTEESMERAYALGINIAFTTGNPLFMVKDRQLLLPELEQVSGVFSGGADVRWLGARRTPTDQWLSHPEVWQQVKQLQKQLLQDFKNNPEDTPLVLFMSANNFIVDEELLKEATKGARLLNRLKEDGGHLVWPDAKKYLTSNLPEREQKEVMGKTFEKRILSLEEYDRMNLDLDARVQIAYIKGLGMKDEPDQRKLDKIYNRLAIQKPADNAKNGILTGTQPEYKITLMCTNSHWELFVSMPEITKAWGLNKLRSEIPPDRMVLGVGDSINDLPIRDGVQQGIYRNALFVGVADTNWKMTRWVTGKDGGDSPLKPKGSGAHKVLPGFAYDALSLLCDLVYAAREIKENRMKKNVVDYAAEKYRWPPS